MKCFVIMPIGDPSTDEGSRRFEHVYTHWIKTAVEELQNLPDDCRIVCHRADQENRPGDIVTQIVQALADSDVVIADLTGRNPNVFYELGVRHALRNGTILLTQDISDVPFDLRGQRTICYRYDPESLIRLKRQLQAALSEVLSSKTQIDNPVRRFLCERQVAQEPAASLPAGQDALKQLIGEMNAVREDLAERLVELRDLVQDSTASPTQLSTLADHDLSFLEGAWVSLETGGLHVIQRVGSELRAPYCFQSDHELTGHYFNIQVIGRQLVCRFRWFEQAIEGCVILRSLDKNRLVGGWWYIQELPEGARIDLRQLHEQLPSMNPVHLQRVPMPKPLPEWVTDYFRRASAGEL